jgi:carbamoyltransferase
MVIQNDPAEGWESRACTVSQLAELLHTTDEPVVVLNDRAELGPRALGNRSILAAAVRPDMKDRLNAIKQREDYRPVSPICIEEHAPAIFSPGTRDPYMLFDHMLRDEWVERIPAIRHLDGTARLQTVSREDNPLIYDLLHAYEKLSGIPVLCNTSANLLGSGFFPDVRSATEWNGTRYVWCNETLYEKQ